MKANFKTYRIAAFALIIVLGLNVIIPAAVLGAGFYCNIGAHSTADTVNPGVDHCIANELFSVSGLSDDQDIINHCTALQACSQSISEPFSEFESLLPVEKNRKAPVAVSAFFNSHLYADGWDAFRHISAEASLPYPSPPLFLLNNTFLN